MITNEYKGRIFNNYVEVTCFIQAKKVKQRKRYGCCKKNEDLLSKCQEQVQVSPLPPSTSKLIKTGAK